MYDIKKEQVEKALMISDQILTELEDKHIDENIAQAALGLSWFTVCRDMGFKKDELKEIIDDVFEE